jgi:cytoskeleton protein RodZ
MVLEAELEAHEPLDSAGDRLLRAREAAGLTRAQVAAETKIPERHLAAIEQGNFASLPARTYAVGFSRSYAKAVGENEAEIIAAVRGELAEQGGDHAPRAAPVFEPGDPARVPSSALTWLALLAALGLVIAGLFFGWRTYFAPGGTLPSLVSDEPAARPAAAPSAAAAAPAVSGPVVFTATQPGIWVKFYDGAGNQLLQTELALGESYTVPAEIADVKLWTARPEALSITIAGQAVAPLSAVQQMLKDVPVSAAALLARGASPAASASAAAAPSPAGPQAAARQPVARRSAAAVNAARSATGVTPSPAAVTLPVQPAPQGAGVPAETAPAANQPADR